MEGILVLVGLVVLAIPIAVIALLISVSGLKSRVTWLETELAKQRNADGQAARQPRTDPAPQPTQTERPPRPADASPAAAVVAARAARTKDRETITVAAAPPPPATPAEPSVVDRFISWITANWFYAVSALSLALAGLFLVQYGVENGLLPPTARVAAAAGFGALLIAGGEYIRRRFGDDVDSTTAYLPSVFSGAGIVSLFGAVLSARLLYDLIGAEAALVGMVVVALMALVLGWFHGPLLAGVGVLGAFAAPFVVGGSSDDPTIFYAYFALIAALGLGIDTLKRWAWVSVLSVVLAYVAGWMLANGDPSTAGALGFYVTALAVMATLVPARSVWPDHSGAMLVTFWKYKAEHPGFATLLAAAALAASSVSLVLVALSGPTEFWVALLCLTGLGAAFMLWSVRGPALQDIAAFPVLGLAVAVSVAGDGREVIYRTFAATYAETPEADFPWTVSVLVAIGVGLSLLAAWRSLRQGDHPQLWAAAAALIGPGLAILIEVTWQPALVIGAYPWALHAALIAVVMTVLAERFGRVDGPEERTRVSLFVLSALASITFALVLILSLAALTAALAVVVVVAAALDRRFDLPLMAWFVAAGVATLGYRLVVDPGLEFGIEAALPDMLLSYAGAFGAMLAGLWLLRGKGRPEAHLMLDSAAWSFGGLLVSLLIFRAISNALGEDDVASHWAMGLMATIWLGLALAQVQRMAGKPVLRYIRAALGAVFGLIGLGALALAATVFSPIFSSYFQDVAGPPLINTLAVAYLLPALVLAAGAWRIRDMPAMLRWACLGLGGALGAYWAFSVIRHFWQGPDAMDLDLGMGQPELYTYTVVLLVAGAAVFYQSLAARSVMMRRAGLVLIGLAVAKVFLIDISGLGGLTRVFSLLVLGLSLAGLAWLNRWADAQEGDGPAQSDSAT